MTYSRGERRHSYNGNAVGALLGERLGRLGIADKIREHTAPLVWAEMVGPQIAGATEVERVKDGVLYVSCRSSMWAQELTFHKADILRRLNDRIGARPGLPLVTELRFQSKGVRRNTEKDEPRPARHPSRLELEDMDLSPAELATIEEGVSVVTDEGLRARMRQVRIANARVRTWRIDNGWAPCPTCGEIAPPVFPYNGEIDCSRCRVAHHLGR